MTFQKSILLPVFLCLAIFSCQPVESDLMVMTVNGSMFASDMETTLSHEHVMVDWVGADSTGYHRWNRAEVIDRVLPYFLEAREKGIHTIIEFTPAYLGRDPYILQELSQRSGIWAITNTGYYGAVDNKFMPAHAYEESAGEIAGRWIDEFVNGINGSQLKPGFMKISVAGDHPLSELHQKIVRAAAITHLETGMSIASHTNGDVPAIAQIELLKNEGVSPSAWIWTHAQSGSLEANIQAATEGAWIALDGVNHDPAHEPGETGSIEWYANRIMKISNAGFLDRILISHDAGWYDVGEPDGGNYRGYTDIVDYLVPELLEHGFGESEIRQLMEINPQQAFGIRIRSFE